MFRVLIDDSVDHYLDSLHQALNEFSLSLSDDLLRACLQHLDLVLDKNKVMNLTRITSIDEALIRHIVDSLVLLPEISRTDGVCLDMGTGAGFPGIPLALATNPRAWTLLDSVGKKVMAVQEFCSALNLQSVSCVHDRLETFAIQHGYEFGCITSRAVASLPTLLEYARPLVSDQGVIVVTKGNLSSEERSQGLKAARILGCELADERVFDLPSNQGHRVILTYSVVKDSSIALPRPVGFAKKKPLA